MLRLVDEDGDILIEFDEDDVNSIQQHYMSGWPEYMCDAVHNWWTANGFNA